MQCVLLIVEGRGSRRVCTAAEGQARYEQMLAFNERLKTSSVLLASNSLKSDTEAVRLAERDGRRSLVDGPFAESKEFVGGFFLIECAGKDEALAYAADCPARVWATVEVRESGPCFE